MDAKREQSLLALARETSPHFVADRDGWDDQQSPGVNFTFLGKPNPFTVLKILSFQGSLKAEFGISSKLCSLDDGCIEAKFRLASGAESRRLLDLVESRDFDRLAYIYSIIAAAFYSEPEAPRFRFYSEDFSR